MTELRLERTHSTQVHGSQFLILWRGQWKDFGGWATRALKKRLIRLVDDLAAQPTLLDSEATEPTEDLCSVLQPIVTSD